MYSMIYIEPVFGCNRKCDFCPHCYLEKPVPIQYMADNVVDALVAHTTSSGRKLKISLALRGEPSLHPKLPEIINKFAKCDNARVLLLTNGYKLSQEWINTIFEAGLFALHIDTYDQKTVDLAHSITYPVPAVYISGGNIWTTSKPLVVVCDERESRYNCIRAIHNWAGALPQKYWIGDVPRQSACAHPLKMITVRHDGRYALCCMRWHDELDLGNALTKNFDEHYNSKQYMDICNAIMRRGGRNNVAVCNKCTGKSPRAHVWKRALRERGYDI